MASQSGTVMASEGAPWGLVREACGRCRPVDGQAAHGPWTSRRDAHTFHTLGDGDDGCDSDRARPDERFPLRVPDDGRRAGGGTRPYDETRRWPSGVRVTRPSASKRARTGPRVLAKSAMIPSPMTWLTVPSYRWTASIISSSTGSRILRASSGSRSASSSIEPLRSANRTVTCLRSPSKAAFDMRIFSARCFGVYDSGDENTECAVPFGVASASGVPHLLQKRDPMGSSVPHEAQVRARRVPQARQKLDPDGFSCWHRGHCMPGPPSGPWRSGRWAEASVRPGGGQARLDR